MSAVCGHQICELIVLLQRERNYTGEPSNDEYSREPSTRCFITEPRQGEMQPHFAKANADDAVRFVERLPPEAVRAEIERLRMLVAARALAKFVSAEAGNREALRAKLADAVEETRRGGQNTAIPDERLQRLYSLGILTR